MEGIIRSLSRAGSIVWSIGRETAVSLRHNWGIALLAIALAVSLWAFVTDEDDTERTARVPGQVAVQCVNIPAGKAESPPCSEQTVTLRVSGPEGVLDSLVPSDFTATADLADVTSDIAMVRVQVETAVSRIEIVDIAPEQIEVQLENLTTRNVPVRARLVGVPPRGYEARMVTVVPQEAVVSGPESLVQRVAAVEADIDLTAARTNFEQRLLLHPRDEQSGDIQNVNVEPETGRVQVEMVQLEFSAPFVVQPAISGTPAAGFIAAGVEVNPPFVVISGPAEIFQSLDPVRGVQTESISIDGASADVVRTVALRLPNGARVEQPGVTVRVLVQPASISSGRSTPAARSSP